jgi:Na+-transporting methylmalonyl-CoA/oxaloacetate decarboxylase gamma subunit
VPLFVILVLALLVVVMLLVGAVVTKEQIERQNRILRLKRFRRETSGRKAGHDAGEKRTLV